MNAVSYTLEDWMRGVPPPEARIETEKRLYVYGVGEGAGGKIIPFTVRKEGARVPKEVLRVLEVHEVFSTAEEAKRLRGVIYAKYEPQQKAALAEEKTRKAHLGRVAAHSDGQGVHMAILLDPSPECFALFLTSRPGWARKFRPITADEKALCGIPVNHRTTFLAPVIRPRDEFSLTEKQFPESRVAGLLHEFRREDAT